MAPMAFPFSYKIKLITDWRTGEDDQEENVLIDEQEEPSRKKFKSQTPTNVYNKIKASLIKDPQENASIQFTPSAITDTKNTVLSKIIECSTILLTHQCLGNKFYSQVGFEMGKLKVLYMKKCDICMLAELDPNDIFSALNCRRCVARSNTKEFFSTIKTSINYGISHTNFLISLARLCARYPKFKQVSVPIADISRHMRFLTYRIEEDSAFWLNDE